MYQVLARKWRPKNFHELVGQQHITQALTYALNHDRIHHAYLFTGTRGVGKTTIARIFAKSLNCQTNGVSAEPCGTCEYCREIDQGRFPDLIEVDAASRTSVDDTRELLDNVPYTPIKGRYKVYLIDEVHMFSRSSFNALLKTLEEPPPHVKFILATTDPQKLPATVLSRCLQFHLKNMTIAQIVAHLQTILDHDGLTYEVDALRLLAEAGMGSMRDSLSLLDQAIAYGRGMVNSKDVAQLLGAVPTQQLRTILTALTDADAPALRRVLHTLDEFAPDYQDLLKKLLYQLQEITIVQLDAERYSGEIDEAIKTLAARLPVELVQLWYQIATDGWQNLAYQPDIRLAVEMILLRMIALRPMLPTADPDTLRDIPASAPAPAGNQEASLDEIQALLHDDEPPPWVQEQTATSPQVQDRVAQDAVKAAGAVNHEQHGTDTVDDEPPPWVQAQTAAPQQVQDGVAQDAVKAAGAVNHEQHGTDTVDDEPPPWVQKQTATPPQVQDRAAQDAVKAAGAVNHEQTAPMSQAVMDNTTHHSPSAGSAALPNAAHVVPEQEASQASSVQHNDAATVVQGAEQQPADDNPTDTSNATAAQSLHVDLADCARDAQVWAETVARLDLPGEVGAVAEHSVVLAWQPPILTLGVGEGTMMFADAAIQQALSAALSAVIAAPCEVQCQVDAAQQTPAVLREQALHAQQQQAEAAIYTHPAVKQLQQDLGAVVVPGSIVSLTTQANRS